ncbi:aldo/keto reductase [uncultured Microbacterium sp.]|jgi:aryl-alcohol dehydrogenase-like predicted oxidoreductase|uniref:aldo/keto reductase n=1 Tax=uncultured Microbacterium sp. TaxID=191216 RepID=UPI0025E5B149|nr:aldo/keto reductase [uncultured Microbacterium sp.]
MTLTPPALPHVTLGQGASALEVTALGYGGMSLTDVYGAISDDDALATLTHAVDRGVTFIDTANIYGGGRSEKTIAKLLRDRRDEVVLATKFGITGTQIGKRSARGDAAYVHEQIDESLARLGTNHVDLYYQHRVDPNTPIEETVGAMAELVTAGKVRFLGLSEPTADELRRAHAVHPITAVQTEWNLVSRDIELSVVPTAVELGVGIVPYSPLSRGWLTDAFTPDDLGEGDGRHSFPRFSPENLAANAELRAQVVEIARASGLTTAQLALAWLFARADQLGVTIAPIPGSRFPARIDEWLGALDRRPDASALATLDAIAPAVSGSRSFDRAWVSLRGEPDEVRG